jgi:hypothetical protein
MGEKKRFWYALIQLATIRYHIHCWDLIPMKDINSIQTNKKMSDNERYQKK